MEIIIALLGAAVGTGVGYYVFQSRASSKQQHAGARADKLVADAETKAKQVLLDAQDEALKVKQSGKDEEQSRRKQLEAAESRIGDREQKLDTKEQQLDQKREELDKQRAEIAELKSEISEIKDRQLKNLEKVAKLKQAEAKDVLLKMVEGEFEPALAKRVRQMEAAAKEEGDERAAKIIATVIQRNASEQAAEMTVTTVQLPNEQVKGRIIGKEGRNIQSFEKLTGADVIVDDDAPDRVLISCFNPVRRQVARLALERMVKDGRINPSRIEEQVAKAEKEINKITQKAGEDTLFELGLTKINPDLTKLLGTMRFRTSYGQNVLKHSAETARIAEMLAHELGTDPKSAKLAGLFHDIGKAVTHEVEGPHALIGQDICKKYGLPDDVCHAVGAHHEDIAIESTLDILTQTADAISGARPGARRESFEQYVKRLQDLENVANSFDGVGKSYAIQAGREVRIIVKPEEVDDLSTTRLAKDVAERIEKEMTYPGQIKVNVIREIRAAADAK